MLKQLIISSIALAAVAAAPSVQAQESQLPSVTVSFAGLDTRSEPGVQIMLQRIKQAASKVCGPAPSPVLDRQQKFAPCVDEVTKRTVAGLNNSQLTAAWNKDSGIEPATHVARAR